MLMSCKLIARLVVK